MLIRIELGELGKVLVKTVVKEKCVNVNMPISIGIKKLESRIRAQAVMRGGRGEPFNT